MKITVYLFVFIYIFVCFVNFGNTSERTVSNAFSRGWKPSTFHTRSSLGENEIKVKIALSQRNLKQLEDEFWAVSTPSNVNYGKHKSFQEVVDLVAPTQSTIDQVTNYFREKGIPSEKIELNPSRDFMNVHMTIAQAEEIFQTVYEPYLHKRTGEVAVGMSGTYKLDERIDPHIDFVSRFGKLSVPKVQSYASSTPEFVKNKFVPSNVPSNIPEKAPRSTRASSAPYIRPISDFLGVFAYLLILCPDGTGPAISGNPRSGTTKFDCGNTTIPAVYVDFYSEVTDSPMLFGILNVSVLTAYKCADQNETCLPVAQYYDLDVNGAFIAVLVDGSPGNQLPVFVPYRIRAYAIYSDNTTSDIGVSNEVEGSLVALPFVFNTFYYVPEGTIVTQSTNNQSVVQYEGQSYNPDDLRNFFLLNSLPDYSNLVKVVHPENNDPSNPGGEASLDIQTIMGIAQNCTTIFWANNDTKTTVDPHLEWITDVLNSPNSPILFSVSYGNSESYDYSGDYITRTNIEFMKAGLRGITLIYASGDDGPFSNGGLGGDVFDPSFPASSPYVTSVGGTQMYSAEGNPSSCYSGGKNNYTCPPDEVACSIANGAGITSGGGFSNIFPRPSYQDAAVTAYLANIQSLSGKFNASNRAYPDVSLVAHNAPAVIAGALTYLDGTSASAPFFAGLVTLLNDIRLAGGNAPLGFLNPLIYSAFSIFPDAFYDITRGDSNCSRILCYSVGYPALPGYDTVTGVGSPVFYELAVIVSALPPTNSTSTSTSTSTSSSSSSSSSSTTAKSSTSTSSTTSSSSSSSPSSTTTTGEASTASSIFGSSTLATLLLAILFL